MMQCAQRVNAKRVTQYSHNYQYYNYKTLTYYTFFFFFCLSVRLLFYEFRWNYGLFMNFVSFLLIKSELCARFGWRLPPASHIYSYTNTALGTLMYAVARMEANERKMEEVKQKRFKENTEKTERRDECPLSTSSSVFGSHSTVQHTHTQFNARKRFYHVIKINARRARG